MPTLTITKTYSDGPILTKAQLDNFETSLATFLNTTLLDEDNIDIDAIISNLTESQAVSAINKNGYSDKLSDTEASSDVTFNTSTWTSTGLSLDLPDAGDYLIIANCRFSFASTTLPSRVHSLTARLRDTTNNTNLLEETNIEMTFTETDSTYTSVMGETVYTVPFNLAIIINIAGAVTIDLQGLAGSAATSEYVADTGQIKSFRLK
jgi:hypothetical protein